MGPRQRRRRSAGPESPLAPFLTARAASARGTTALATTLLYAILCALAVMAIVWSQYVVALDDAADNVPTSTRLTLSRLSFQGPDVITLAAMPRVVVYMFRRDPASPEVSRDLELGFGPEALRVQTRFSRWELPYPLRWEVTATGKGLATEWEPWRFVFLGLIFLAAFAAIACTWVLLAALYTLPVFAIANIVMEREISPGGAWRICLLSLVPGGLFGVALFGVYTFGLIDLLTLAVCLPAQLIVGWLWLWMTITSLPWLDPDDFSGEDESSLKKTEGPREQPASPRRTPKAKASGKRRAQRSPFEPET